MIRRRLRATLHIAGLFLVIGTPLAMVVNGINWGTLAGTAAMSLIFAGVASWIVGRKHDRAVRALIATPASHHYRPLQSCRFQLNASVADTLRICETALLAQGMRGVKRDDARARVTGRFRSRGEGWGEIVTVIVEAANGRAEVRARSRPVLTRLVVYDYGRNFRRLLDFHSLVRSHANDIEVGELESLQD